MAHQINVEFHRPEWRTQFESAAAQLQQALGENVTAIHQIGSTAIAGIVAKPIIDILIEAKSLSAVDSARSSMEKIGYEAKGEYGIPGRRYFRKETDAGVRSHHVHVFLEGSEQTMRHLGFRDYMNANPAWAQKYSALKADLAASFSNDAKSYVDGKNAFIQNIDQIVLSERNKRGM